MTDDQATVGETPIARTFYAGRYAEIIQATYDAGVTPDPADIGFVIGALAFLGRIDDAVGCLDTSRAFAGERPHPPRTLALARFFLGLAWARAGTFDRAFPLLVTAGFRARHDADPWVRALVFQGLACHCYFTGRFPGAVRNALRAKQAAHAAGFLYGSMLATDMSGHALVQMGQLQRGIAMLEQANKLAHRLGLTNNSFAVEASIAQYAARFIPHSDALERIEKLLRRRAHDSYSHRALLLEAAVQRALRGRRTEALAALEEAERDALRGDTRRGKVSTLLARLWITRWQHGPAACRLLLDQARQLIEPRDVAYLAELLGFEILCARTAKDSALEQRSLADLRELLRATHHVAARAALGQLDAMPSASPFDEDALTPILRAVARRDTSLLSRIVGLGLAGVIPELLGLSPSRRIILLPSEDLLLIEDHGDIVVRRRPPRWCPVVLRILASGDATKERIVAGLWGLRAYRPDIHDPPVRTTIHRLRAFLKPHSDWIEVSESGYRTSVPVYLVAGGDTPNTDTPPLWEEGELPALESPQLALRGDDAAVGIVQLVYQRLGQLEEASVPALARSLGMSASTVLRALRVLVETRQAERLGFARATRYRLQRTDKDAFK